MSVYTTEVRFICEQYAGYDASQEYDKVEEIIAASKDKIFDFSFPIFDESYRGVLETKILKHYYTREIGLETVGLWKLKLNTRMNEIMPYYNKLYKSELIEFNPLYDIDYTRDYKKTNDDESNTTTEGGGENSRTSENDSTNSGTNTNSTVAWQLVQDTPQNGLTDVDNMNYLSGAVKNTNTENGSYSNTGSDDTSESGEYSYNSSVNNELNGIEDYIEHVKGTHGGVSYSKKIEEFRKTFLNIDMQIIDNLKDLFMYLW